MFPQRPVRLVVPFGVGGASDALARAVGARLSQRWGVEIEFDNRPGEGAVEGATAAAQSDADGHTLLFGTSTTHCIAPALHGALPYDPAADFAPLARIGWAPNLLLVRRGLATDVAELIVLARAQPGRLTYASAGAGQTIHLCAALFERLAGVSLTHVPYASGSAAGLEDLVHGRVDLMFDNVLASLGKVRAGKVDVLAVAGATPLPALPAVPALVDAGVPGYAADIWMGLFAPRATPDAIVRTLQHDLVTVLGQTDLVAELRDAGLMLDVAQGEHFADEIAANAAQWRAIVATCAIEPD